MNVAGLTRVEVFRNRRRNRFQRPRNEDIQGDENDDTENYHKHNTADEEQC